MGRGGGKKRWRGDKEERIEGKKKMVKLKR